MKIKVDENRVNPVTVPYAQEVLKNMIDAQVRKVTIDSIQKVATLLRDLGHDVHTVGDEALIGQEDREIWQAAQKESRFLITQDLDFSDTRRFVPGSHHGILVMRLRSPNRTNLVARIQEVFQSESIDKWAACFVVATEHKIRILKARGRTP